MLTVLAQSVIRSFQILLSQHKESMAVHMGIKEVFFFFKWGKRNTKGSMLGPRWKSEAERACFCLSGV
jgi:hypothetical protein